MSVIKKINAAAQELSEIGIAKLRKNEQQGFKFRGIDDVLNAISPILAKHGLVVIPSFADRTVTERDTAKGGKLYNVTLNGTFSIHADDGSSITVGPFPGEAMDSADKATNKAMSASYKYFALMTFAIPVTGTPDADEDGDEAPPAEKPVDVEGWIKTFAGCETKEELLQAWAQAKLACEAAKNPDAYKVLQAARNARGKALTAEAK